MNTTKTTSRIEFANSLRGVAVLLVLFGHYVMVFNALKAGYINFPPLDDYPFPWSNTINRSFPFAYINLGQFAVALFFLVSGLVIPNSAASLIDFKRGRVAFVIGRFFRIWPTYAIGLLVSVATLWFNSYANSSEFYMPLTRVISNMSLFRDWMGQTQFDGVVWTLEIETKFYLFVLLFWSAIGRGKLYPVAAICIATLIASPIGAIFEKTLEPTVTLANFLWTLPYILYMTIGVIFNYHLRGLLTTKSLLIMAIGMYGVFVISAKIQGLYAAVPISYGSTLMLFGSLYFFAKEWNGGPIIQFFSRISFPLYASHAAFGYTGMAYMVSLGANPYAAVSVQFVISTCLAWSMHILVEVPTHNAGKRIGKKMITTTRPITVSNNA